MKKFLSILSHAITALVVLGVCGLAVAAPSTLVITEEASNSVLRVTADGQVKGAPGYVHIICFEPTTATPTAGLVTVYDSLTETGTQILSKWFFATNNGQCEIVDTRTTIGIFVGYDATVTNMSVTVTYR